MGGISVRLPAASISLGGRIRVGRATISLIEYTGFWRPAKLVRRSVLGNFVGVYYSCRLRRNCRKARTSARVSEGEGR